MVANPVNRLSLHVGVRLEPTLDTAVSHSLARYETSVTTTYVEPMGGPVDYGIQTAVHRSHVLKQRKVKLARVKTA